MSYILEALKKSDQERQRGTVPDLHTVQVSLTRRPERRPGWTYLVALALLLNAGLLLWWLQPWHSEKPKSVEPVGTGQQLEANVKESDRRPSNARQLAPSKALETTRTERTETLNAAPKKPTSAAGTQATHGRGAPVQSVDDAHKQPAGVKPPTGPSSRSTLLEDGKGTQDVSPKKPQTNPGIARAGVEPPRKLNSSAKRTESSPQGTADPDPAATPTTAFAPAEQKTPKSEKVEQRGKAPAKQAPPVEAKEALDWIASYKKENPVTVEPSQPGKDSSPGAQASTEQRLLDLRDLPMPIQRELPNMSFSMVIYSGKPADRMISINGRMMHEGQEISSGLKIEEITPDGAILSFRGHRFHKGVF